MNPRVVRTRCILIALCLTAAVGCSRVLEWDTQGMPCEEGLCLDGFSCLSEVCITEGTVLKEGACSADSQCDDGLICGVGGCAVPCAQWYQPANECPEGEYCEEEFVGGEYRGYCVAGSEVCRTFPGDPCDNDDLQMYCVEMSTDVFACMGSCDISWGEGNIYEDTCGTDEVVEACQPLGIHGQLVCREERGSAGVIGASCDNVEGTCASGYGCVEGTCQLYCNADVSDAELSSNECGEQTCCDGFKYDLCKPDCTF